MKKQILLHLFILCCAYQSYSQVPAYIAKPPDANFECGFQGPTTSEEREKLPYFGNSKYLKKVLKEKAGIELGKDYEKEVERKGYIPFDFRDFQDIRGTEDHTNLLEPNVIHYNVVPVTVWVYRRNDGTGGVTRAQAEAFFQEVRTIFTPTGINIYMLCNIQFVNSSQYFSLANRSEYLQMVSANRVSPNLNVHLVNDLDFAEGTSSFPTDATNHRYACAVGVGETAVIGNEGNVIAHEIGHTLGLLHTHHFRYDSANPYVTNNGECVKCHQESTSRSRNQGLFCYRTFDRTCEVNGDMLCDTPADPLLNATAVTTACGLNRPSLWSQSDRWGDAWQPNTQNVMAYGRFGCLTTFTASQVAIMMDNLNPSWTHSSDITGPTALCSGATATYTAPHTGASYQWTVPSGWTIQSGQGTRQITVVSGSSSGRVQANPSCGNPNLSLSVNVSSGAVTISGPNTFCSNYYDWFSTTYFAGATYVWEVSQGMTIRSGQGTSSASIAAGSNFNGGYIRVTYTLNGCSSGGGKVISKGPYCSSSYAILDSISVAEQMKGIAESNPSAHEIVYPNPSNDEVTINFGTADARVIQLLDETGRELFNKETKADRFNFLTSRYPEGLYYIKITSKQESSVNRIYIKK